MCNKTLGYDSYTKIQKTETCCNILKINVQLFLVAKCGFSWLWAITINKGVKITCRLNAILYM